MSDPVQQSFVLDLVLVAFLLLVLKFLDGP